MLNGEMSSCLKCYKEEVLSDTIVNVCGKHIIGVQRVDVDRLVANTDEDGSNPRVNLY